jgi:hypothetical protein
MRVFLKMTWLHHLLVELGFPFNNPTPIYCNNESGQAHPWVVSLGVTQFNFPRPIELWKIIKKHLNKHFRYFFMNTSILGVIDFEISIILRILCILMFLIIAFRKSFKNKILIFFFQLFGQEHEFETWFVNFLMNIFLTVIWKSLFLNFLLGN